MISVLRYRDATKGCESSKRKMCEKLKISIRHINTVLVIMAVASVFIYAYDTGNGVGHIKATDTTICDIALPSASTLDVIYERNDRGHSDFLHLQVDTTYNTRGKGSFSMQPTCSRNMTARLFDGAYHPTDIRPEECFVFNAKAATRWIETGVTRRIAGYDCHCAEATYNGRTWEVWYTDRLPHCPENVVATDGLKGLILEVISTQGEPYSLKARHISQKIA